MSAPTGSYVDLARQVREKREAGVEEERSRAHATRDKTHRLVTDLRANERAALELPVPQRVIAHLVDARDLLERYLAEVESESPQPR